MKEKMTLLQCKIIIIIIIIRTNDSLDAVVYRCVLINYSNCKYCKNTINAKHILVHLVPSFND